MGKTYKENHRRDTTPRIREVASKGRWGWSKDSFGFRFDDYGDQDLKVDESDNRRRRKATGRR